MSQMANENVDRNAQFIWKPQKPIQPYICSTLNGFPEERDVLVSYLFPQLNKLCLQGTYFRAVDLRWPALEVQALTFSQFKQRFGLHSQYVKLCLHCVNSCFPLFICMLGQTYGDFLSADSPFMFTEATDLPSLPSMEQNLYVAAENGYPWILDNPSYSLTKFEIIQAALLNESELKYFYFGTGTTLLKAVDEEKEGKLSSGSLPSKEEKLRIGKLKAKIITKGLPVTCYKDVQELGELVFKDWLVVLEKETDILNEDSNVLVFSLLVEVFIAPISVKPCILVLDGIEELIGIYGISGQKTQGVITPVPESSPHAFQNPANQKKTFHQILVQYFQQQTAFWRVHQELRWQMKRSGSGGLCSFLSSPSVTDFLSKIQRLSFWTRLHLLHYWNVLLEAGCAAQWLDNEGHSSLTLCPMSWLESRPLEVTATDKCRFLFFIARVLKLMGKTKEAEVLLLSAGSVHEMLLKVQTAIGELSLEIGTTQKAFQYFQKAWWKLMEFSSSDLKDNQELVKQKEFLCKTKFQECLNIRRSLFGEKSILVGEIMEFLADLLIFPQEIVKGQLLISDSCYHSMMEALGYLYRSLVRTTYLGSSHSSVHGILHLLREIELLQGRSCWPQGVRQPYSEGSRNGTSLWEHLLKLNYCSAQMSNTVSASVCMSAGKFQRAKSTDLAPQTTSDKSKAASGKGKKVLKPIFSVSAEDKMQQKTQNNVKIWTGLEKEASKKDYFSKILSTGTMNDVVKFSRQWILSAEVEDGTDQITTIYQCHRPKPISTKNLWESITELISEKLFHSSDYSSGPQKWFLPRSQIKRYLLKISNAPNTE
ncbi:LOW QUALITY PROTEIN: putative tetratricopeptide repeat protein 41 [Rhynchonycteris naso]